MARLLFLPALFLLAITTTTTLALPAPLPLAGPRRGPAITTTTTLALPAPLPPPNPRRGPAITTTTTLALPALLPPPNPRRGPTITTASSSPTDSTTSPPTPPPTTIPPGCIHTNDIGEIVTGCEGLYLGPPKNKAEAPLRARVAGPPRRPKKGFPPGRPLPLCDHDNPSDKWLHKLMGMCRKPRVLPMEAPWEWHQPGEGVNRYHEDQIIANDRYYKDRLSKYQIKNGVIGSLLITTESIGVVISLDGQTGRGW